MAGHERDIRAAWHAFGGGEQALEAVLARHREPHRQYHTVRHVAWVLRTIADLLATEQVDDPAAIRLAAVFHDAVYDPRSSDNEARSAQLAVTAAAELGWGDERCSLVRRLVLATAGHSPVDPSEAVLIDADLGVLGAEPAAYADYVRGVRFEYAHVDDEAWRTGRSEVLHSFIDRPRIFTTDTMFHRAEHRARANIAAELAQLHG